MQANEKEYKSQIDHLNRAHVDLQSTYDEVNTERTVHLQDLKDLQQIFRQAQVNFTQEIARLKVRV